MVRWEAWETGSRTVKPVSVAWHGDVVSVQCTYPRGAQFSKHVSQFQEAHGRCTSTFIAMCGDSNETETTTSVAQTGWKSILILFLCVCYETTHTEDLLCETPFKSFFVNELI